MVNRIISILLFLFCTNLCFAQDSKLSTAQSIYDLNLVKEHEVYGTDVITTGFIAYKYFNSGDTIYVAMNLYDENNKKIPNNNQIIMLKSFYSNEQILYDKSILIEWLKRNYFTPLEINEIFNSINMVLRCPK